MRRFSVIAVWTVASVVWAGVSMAAEPAPKISASAPAKSDAPADTGIRVYRCDIHEAADSDMGAPAIVLVGARNGRYSGKVVISSGAPIAGLKATITDLRQGDATVPAAQIVVRYGVPWESSARPWGDAEGGTSCWRSPAPSLRPAAAAVPWCPSGSR